MLKWLCLFNFQRHLILMRRTENLCYVSGNYCNCCRRQTLESFSHLVTHLVSPDSQDMLLLFHICNESPASCWLAAFSAAPRFLPTERLPNRTSCRRPAGSLHILHEVENGWEAPSVTLCSSIRVPGVSPRSRRAHLTLLGLTSVVSRPLRTQPETNWNFQHDWATTRRRSLNILARSDEIHSTRV